MLSFMDLLVVVGFFALRIGVPLLLTAGGVYLLKRLDRKWEAEARAMQTQPAERSAVRPSAPKPATVVRVPTSPQPVLPWMPPPAMDKRLAQQPGLMAVPAQQPCWTAKGCSDNQRAQCVAPQHPELPCWQARFDAEGAIPEECVKCDIFQRYPMM
jgi:hypothetical protein